MHDIVGLRINEAPHRRSARAVHLAGCSTTTQNLPGWYRMIPPIVNDKPDPAAPFSQWLVNPAHPYDSEQLCQTDLIHRQGDNAHLRLDAKVRGVTYDDPNADPATEPLILWPDTPGNATMLGEQRKLAQCVSSTDPRLNGVAIHQTWKLTNH